MSSDNNGNSTAIIPADAMNIIEQVVVKGDLGKLNEKDRVDYYCRVCASVGLNPLTRPFEYIVLNGRLTLYARKDCTDQLRRIYGVSIVDATATRSGDMLTVKAIAEDKAGRKDCDIGVVNIGNLKGDNLANASMKAMTKAKRRVTLSICGLGMLDESEIETIADARPAGNYSVEGAAGVADAIPPEDVPVIDVDTPKNRVGKLVRQWSGVEQADLGNAVKTTALAAGVKLAPGKRMTNELWEEIEEWCIGHVERDADWKVCVSNQLVA